jgi:hypothetical protein
LRGASLGGEPKASAVGVRDLRRSRCDEEKCGGESRDDWVTHDAAG